MTREMERRLLAAEEAVGIRPLGMPSDVVDESYFAAAERADLRGGFASLQMSIATDCPSLPLNGAVLQAEVDERDARLRELLGGPDTPELAAADRAIVLAWEAARGPVEREAAHRRRWPGRATFGELIDRYRHRLGRG